MIGVERFQQSGCTMGERSKGVGSMNTVHIAKSASCAESEVCLSSDPSDLLDFVHDLQCHSSTLRSCRDDLSLRVLEGCIGIGDR